MYESWVPITCVVSLGECLNAGRFSWGPKTTRRGYPEDATVLVLLLEVLAARALRETVENRCAFVGFTSLPPFGRLGLKKREALRLANPTNSRVDFDLQNRSDFPFFLSWFRTF